MRGAPIGDVAVEDEGAVEDVGTVEDDDAAEDAAEGEVASNWLPRAVALAATTTSRPAARILRIRIRRGGVRPRLRWVTPPVKAAWCCPLVCGFRYAGDRRRL